VERGLITEGQVVAALEWQSKARIPIGKLALEIGLLTAAQVFEILNIQAEDNQPFGQLALRLGFMEEKDLDGLLAEQQRRNRPIGHILADMGIIDPEVVEAEHRRFRQRLNAPAETTSPNDSAQGLAAYTSGG